MSKRRNPSPAWRVQASSNLSFCVIHNWLRLRMVVPNARCTVDILGKATIYFPRIACVRANAFVISSACKKWHHDVAEPRFGSAHKSKLKRHRELYCRLIQDQTLRWRGGGDIGPERRQVLRAQPLCCWVSNAETRSPCVDS